jgi:preprotein translocase subunit SecA
MVQILLMVRTMNLALITCATTWLEKFDQLRQRDLNFAIVDEVDSILIDEARTPLIISAPSATSGASYEQFSKLARQLKRDKHFEVDEKRRAVVLTDAGITYIEKALGISNLYDTAKYPYYLSPRSGTCGLKLCSSAIKTTLSQTMVKLSLSMNLLDVCLKDDATTKAYTKQSKLKSTLRFKKNHDSSDNISFQNYFRLYSKLSGMTGTAKQKKKNSIRSINLKWY